MRFITEDELRTMYKQIPFNTYKVEKNSRLTPGAKQFLTDFRIKLCTEEKLEVNSGERKINIFDKKAEKLKNNYSKMLAIKLKKIAIKVASYDQIQAEKINVLALNIFQGIDLKLVGLEESEKIDTDKLIFTDLKSDYAEVLMDLLQLMIELDTKSQGLIKNIEKDLDPNRKEKLESYLKTLEIVTFEIHRTIKCFNN